MNTATPIGKRAFTRFHQTVTHSLLTLDGKVGGTVFHV